MNNGLTCEWMVGFYVSQVVQKKLLSCIGLGLLADRAQLYTGSFELLNVFIGRCLASWSTRCVASSLGGVVTPPSAKVGRRQR